ncbi:hypothetical protein ACKAV7_008418 [Fusarium commune]
MSSYTQKLPPAGYLHHAITQIKQDFGLPDIFYLDLWPLAPCLLLLTSPDAVAIPTTASNFPMPDVVKESFEGNVGTSFIEATNGPLWKHLMQQLMPGLTPTALKIHYHSIVDHARALHDRLQQYTDIAQTVNMQLQLGKYPFQVLATVFFGETLSEQAYKDTTRMVDLMLTKNSAGALFNPLSKWRWRKEMDRCLVRLEGEIEARICARYAALQEQKGESATAKAPTLLDRMLLPRVRLAVHSISTHAASCRMDGRPCRPTLDGMDGNGR